jgi:hypothetical protein
MSYTLKLVPDWENNLRKASKAKFARRADAGAWKRSEAAKTLSQRIKQLYKLTGDAIFVDEITIEGRD